MPFKLFRNIEAKISTGMAVMYWLLDEWDLFKTRKMYNICMGLSKE
jgi:hypothetical protein